MMPSQFGPPPAPPVLAPLPVISSMRPATIIRPMGTVQVSIGGQSKSIQVLRLETTTISTMGNDSLKLATSGIPIICSSNLINLVMLYLILNLHILTVNEFINFSYVIS